MIKTLIVLTLSATALAADAFPVYNKRQTTPIPCSESSRKACGDGCIPPTYTCCPDQQGGCPLSATCWLGTNGAYGCCPIGRRCTGPGGVDTLPGSTVTSTTFFTKSGPTESVPDDETSTSLFVSTSTSVFTFTSEVEGTSTETPFLPKPTTSSSVAAVANTRTTSLAAPTTISRSTATGAPPVPANGANSHSGPVIRAVAAGAMALFAI
ncbi:GPI anchored serine-threonine rich protein [Colletotrichum falcatum]|nr:GPI anchored serine-threonine rich protein [Colletotrichum falcatum]